MLESLSRALAKSTLRPTPPATEGREEDNPANDEDKEDEDMRGAEDSPPDVASEGDEGDSSTNEDTDGVEDSDSEQSGKESGTVTEEEEVTDLIPETSLPNGPNMRNRDKIPVITPDAAGAKPCPSPATETKSRKARRKKAVQDAPLSEDPANQGKGNSSASALFPSTPSNQIRQSNRLRKRKELTAETTASPKAKLTDLENWLTPPAKSASNHKNGGKKNKKTKHQQKKNQKT